MDEKDLMKNPFQTNAKFDMFKEESEFDKILKNLLIPARSGIYFSRYEIRDIGRVFGVDIPVKERKEMLKDIFQYAKQMDNLKGLLDLLIELIDERISQYNELTELYPRSKNIIDKWVKKAERVKDMIETMKKELDIYPDIPPQG